MTREDVVQAALAWLGTPYHHQGKIKGAGVDCAQLLVAVFHEAGMLPDIDVGYYPHDWHMHRSDEKYLGWVEKYAHRVDTPKPGDVALFKFGRCISHGAIVIEWPRVIHAYIRQGCVLADANDGELDGRLDSFWSLWSDA